MAKKSGFQEYVNYPAFTKVLQQKQNSFNIKQLDHETLQSGSGMHSDFNYTPQLNVGPKYFDSQQSPSNQSSDITGNRVIELLTAGDT